MGRTIVIGGGVIGLACAYELARRGRRVTVVETGIPGAACSSGNTGWIVPSFSAPIPGPGVVETSLRGMLSRDSPVYIKPRADVEFFSWVWDFWRHCNARDYRAGLAAVAALNARTMALFDALAADGVEFEMHRAGVMFVFRDRGAMGHILSELELTRPYGFGQSRALRGDEARDLEPGLSREIVGGILLEQERHLRPETLTAGLVQRLSALGVDIRTGVAVTGLTRRGAALAGVETSGGFLEGETVLIAAGVWSGSLARWAGLRLPLEAGKGYSITITRPEAPLRYPLYLEEARIACSNFNGALRLAGTMELSGVNANSDSRRLAAIRRAAGRYLDDWRRGDGEVEWMGMRPLTPDGLPVMGRVPGWDNLYIATGHAMLGVTLAPATGAAMSDLICTGRSSVDLSAFDPARFHR
jgi:D-amino-acid dehydrogenase